MNRTTLPTSKLVILIENKVNEFISLNKTFSAYDVTLALRADNPNIEIAHQGDGAIVRDVVHNKMVGGAYGGHKSPHAIDYREEHRQTEDGRPFVMYVYDPNWEAELELVQSEADRIATQFAEFEGFTMTDALARADGNIPLRRLDALKAAIIRHANYRGFEFDEDDETFTQIEGYETNDDDEDFDDELDSDTLMFRRQDEQAQGIGDNDEDPLPHVRDLAEFFALLFGNKR